MLRWAFWFYSNPRYPCKISKIQFWINLVTLLIADANPHSWFLALKAIQAGSVAGFPFPWTKISRAVLSSSWLWQCWCEFFIVPWEPLINSLLNDPSSRTQNRAFLSIGLKNRIICFLQLRSLLYVSYVDTWTTKVYSLVIHTVYVSGRIEPLGWAKILQTCTIHIFAFGNLKEYLTESKQASWVYASFRLTWPWSLI